MIGSIRSTSNSFTTRLTLVFASWTDQNIIRIETVHDTFVASFQRIFFLFDFEKISQQLLKVPKVPRSTFRYVWGIHGNIAEAVPKRRPSLARRFRRSAQDFPPMYKRNLREETYIENISNEGVQPQEPIPTSNSMAGRRLVSRLSDRFAAQETRP